MSNAGNTSELKLRSLEGTLFHVLLLQLILPSFLLILLAILLVGHQLTRDLRAQHLQITQSTAYAVTDYLEHARWILDGVAQTATQSSPEQQQLYMQALQEQDGHFDTLAILDPAGNIALLTPSLPPEQKANLLRLTHSQALTDSQAETVLPSLVISPQTGRPIVYMTQPLADQRRVLGILNLSTLQDVIATDLETREYQTVLVAERSGILLAHSHPEPGPQIDQEQIDLAQHHDIDATTWFDTNDGTWTLGGIAPIESTDWVTIVQVSLSTIYAPYARVLIPILLLVPILWSGILWSFRRRIRNRIVAPLTWLNRGADALAAGDFTQAQALSSIPSTFAEVETLALSFEQMGQAIQARQQALQESEAKYRTILESIEDGYYEVDLNGSFTFYNSAMANILGYTEQELAGMNNREYMDRETARSVYRVFNQVYQSDQPAPALEWELIRKDGTKRSVETSTTPIRGPFGQPIGFRGIARDITDRKRAEEKVQQLLNQQIAVNQLALALGESHDLDRIYRTIYEHVCSLMDVKAFIVSAYDADAQLLRAEYLMSDANPPDTHQLPPIPVADPGHGTQSRVIHTGKPFYTPDLQSLTRSKTRYTIQDDDDILPRPPASEDERHTQAAIFVPMKIAGKPIGVMQVQSHESNAYTQEDIELLAGLANVAAIAIQNTRLYGQARSRTDLLEALNAIIAAAAATTDLTSLMKTALSHTTMALSLKHGYIWIAEQHATRGLPSEFGPLAIQTTRAAGLDTPYPIAVEDWRRVTDAEPVSALASVMARFNVQASLSVPILIDEGHIGDITLTSTTPRPWTSEEIALAEAVGRQLGAAAERQRLFQAEREQRELSEALEEAAAAVNSTLNLDQVLDRILDQVERVVPGNAFNILLVEDDTAQAVRWRGYEALGVEAAIASFVASVADYPRLQKMIRTHQPDVVIDTRNCSEWVHVAGWEWLRSCIGSPIQIGDHTVGFVNVDGTQVGQFDAADARRLQAFADHAATAIKNAQLYHQTLDHAAELERRVQERTGQIQAQYARQEAILRSTSDGIIVTNAQGNIIQANPVAHTWLAHTLTPKDATQLRQAVQRLAQQTDDRPEEILELTGLDLELKAAPISDPGIEDAAAVVAVHDVSHLKAMERIKSRFVTNVSHELRTPVTTIKLYTTLMQKTSPEDAKWDQYLTALTQEADHQARLVQDILQVSRIDAGRLEMNPRPISLNELIETAIINRQVLATDRDISLQHDPADLDLTITVDPERMIQVINNLVENAILYTPRGGRVTVTTGMTKSEGRCWATTRVTDTGMGIPDKELDHIFERFFRGEKPRTMQISGTGLGLAIVKEIIELHGGWVDVQSQVDVGTTFIVGVPIRIDHPKR